MKIGTIGYISPGPKGRPFTNTLNAFEEKSSVILCYGDLINTVDDITDETASIAIPKSMLLSLIDFLNGVSLKELVK